MTEDLCTTFECQGTVTVCTDCEPGEDPAECAKRHQTRVDAVRKALGCPA